MYDDLPSMFFKAVSGHLLSVIEIWRNGGNGQENGLMMYY